MTIKQRTVKLANRWGVIIRQSGFPSFEIGLEAPSGYCWDVQLHELVISLGRYSSAANRWKIALIDLEQSGPPKPCTDMECEWCDRDVI